MKNLRTCFFIIFLLVFQNVYAKSSIENHPGYTDLEAWGFFTESHIKQSMRTPLLKQLNTNAKLDTLITQIESIRVQTASASSEQVLQVIETLDALGWETTHRITKNRERITVHLYTQNDDIVGLLVIQHNRRTDDLTWANVVGIIQPKYIGEIGREFDIDTLQKIARYMPGYKPPTSTIAHNTFRTRKSQTSPISNIWDIDHEDFLFRYNRVDGAFLGWRLPLKYRSQHGLAHFGEIGFALGSKRWDYQAGVELFTHYAQSKANRSALGFEIHDITDTQDNWRIGELENSAYALLMRYDLRDYYRREGGSIYLSHDLDQVVQLTGKLTLDNYSSLANTVSWSLFNNRWGSRTEFRTNPAIQEGQMRSIQGHLTIDTRDKIHHPKRGWYTTLSAQKAGGILQGDYNFERYQLAIQRYQPIAKGTRLDLRLKFGTARGTLPTQFQYALGGTGSLSGYPYKSFTGDRTLLFNAIYWLDGERHFQNDWPIDDLSLGAFFDIGATYFASNTNNPIDNIQSINQITKRSVGIALKLEDLHAYIAHPLDSDTPTWQTWLRFSRAF